MSLNTPPPQQNITLSERASEIFYRWMINVKASIDALTGSVATLETGLGSAGNVSATNTFGTDGAIIRSDGIGRNVKSSVWTTDEDGNFRGVAPGSALLTLETKSDNQSLYMTTTYSAANASFLGGRRARGTRAAPTAIQTNDALFNMGGRGHDGTSGVLDGFSGTACLFTFRAAETWSVTAHGTFAAVYTTPNGTTTQVERVQIENAGHFRPAANNAYNLGTASFLWKEVFAAVGVINTSDERLKEVVGDLSFAGQFVDLLEPVMYRWINGGNTMEPCPSGAMEPNPAGDVDADGNVIMQHKMVPVPRDGVRHHAGFLAQRVKSAMDSVGSVFAAWCLANKDDPDSTQFVRPDQLGAVAWEALRQTREQVRKLEQRIAQLEGAK